MKIWMPEVKVERAYKKTADAYSRRTIKKSELQSLIGLLQHVAICCPPGRTFMGRLYGLLRKLHNRDGFHHVTITEGAKADLRFWMQHLRSWSGTTTIPKSVRMEMAEVDLYTDACGFAGGAVFHAPGETSQRWFAVEWSETEGRRHIAWKETRMITLALATWGRFLRNARYTFVVKTDSEATAKAAENMFCRDEWMMAEFRMIQAISMEFNLDVLLKWIPGTTNVIADSISRLIPIEVEPPLAPRMEEVVIPCEY
jgi:hypothetical protein